MGMELAFLTDQGWKESCKNQKVPFFYSAFVEPSEEPGKVHP